MNALTTFNFESISPVRIININDEPWFVAKDVAIALGYTWNGSARVAHVPEQWRGVTTVVTPSKNGVESDSIPQEMIILAEHGLYFFLNRSDKPKAIPFQMKVAEIITTIRKTGRYEAPKPALNYVTANDMENIKRLVWHCSSFMDYEEVFSRAVWYALRDKVGVKSPEAFKVEDLPLLGEEFNRIIHIIQPYLKARREAEKQLISRLIRGRGDYEPIMKDILYHMRDSVEEQIKNTRVQANGIFKRDFNALIERKAVC